MSRFLTPLACLQPVVLHPLGASSRCRHRFILHRFRWLSCPWHLLHDRHHARSRPAQARLFDTRFPKPLLACSMVRIYRQRQFFSIDRRARASRFRAHYVSGLCAFEFFHLVLTFLASYTIFCNGHCTDLSAENSRLEFVNLKTLELWKEADDSRRPVGWGTWYVCNTHCLRTIKFLLTAALRM